LRGSERRIGRHQTIFLPWRNLDSKPISHARRISGAAGVHVAPLSIQRNLGIDGYYAAFSGIRQLI
jgi:hypothetical protein